MTLQEVKSLKPFTLIKSSSGELVICGKVITPSECKVSYDMRPFDYYILSGEQYLRYKSWEIIKGKEASDILAKVGDNYEEIE